MTAHPAPTDKPQINWDVSKADSRLIDKIIDRAIGVAIEAGIESSATSKFRLVLTMDLTATHANGCPLRLADLLNARDFDFSHDIFGIRQYVDRETGQLAGFFVPRFAKPELASAEAAS